MSYILKKEISFESMDFHPTYDDRYCEHYTAIATAILGYKTLSHAIETPCLVIDRASENTAHIIFLS